MNRKGMSLIELLIVIAIIGIVGSVATFGWKRYVSNADLRTFAREVESDIKGTRQKAISRGMCYRIVISLSDENNKYTVQRGNNGNCESVTSWTNMYEKDPDSLRLSAGQIIKSTSYGSNNVIFQTRGTLSAGNVVLENNRGSNALIRSNITGKTYVTFDMQ